MKSFSFIFYCCWSDARGIHATHRTRAQSCHWDRCRMEQAEISSAAYCSSMSAYKISISSAYNFSKFNCLGWANSMPGVCLGLFFFFSSVCFHVSVLGFWHFQLAPVKHFWEQDQEKINFFVCCRKVSYFGAETLSSSWKKFYVRDVPSAFLVNIYPKLKS